MIDFGNALTRTKGVKSDGPIFTCQSDIIHLPLYRNYKVMAFKKPWSYTLQNEFAKLPKRFASHIFQR